MSPVRRTALGALLATVMVLGCYAPQIGDGALGCADGGACPRGFSCRADRRCWRPSGVDGGGPDADGGGDRPAGGGEGGHGGGTGGEGARGEAGSGEAGTGEGGSGPGGRGGVGGRGGSGQGGVGAAGTSGRGGVGGQAGSGQGTGGGGRAGSTGSAGSGSGGVSGHSGSGGDNPDGAAGRGGTGGAGPIDASTDASGDAARKTLGAPCGSGLECDSGFCVDGLCCDGSCSGACEACDTSSPGRCSPVTSGRPHGTRPACAGSGACAGFCSAASRAACTFPSSATACGPQTCASGLLTPAAVCDGAGACPTATARACGGGLACNDAGTACLTACRGDADCLPPTPYCQGSSCTAARPDGTACTSDGQCQGGRCVDDVCCAEACSDPCQACDVTGHLGACWPIPSRQAPHAQRAPCAGAGVCGSFCNGSSAQCVFPGAETACTCDLLSGTCNGAGQCQGVAGLCL